MRGLSAADQSKGKGAREETGHECTGPLAALAEKPMQGQSQALGRGCERERERAQARSHSRSQKFHEHNNLYEIQ